MAPESQRAPTAIEGNKFTRKGYTFIGWSTAATGQGVRYAPGATYSFKKSVTLFARWKKTVSKAPKPPAKPAHVVTFLANGGTGHMSAESRRSAAALSADSYVRTGYTFVGWNTKANGAGVSYANTAVYSFQASIDLYAQWKKNVPTPRPIADGVVVGPFATGSSTLTSVLESQLDALAALAKSKGTSQITLYGCGDEVGAPRDALGRDRAGAVATYLGTELAKLGLKGWSIAISTASPSPNEVSSVVAVLS